jgi:DNA modification methylase
MNIICADAFDWLKKQSNQSLDTVVTGIPDLDELENLQSKNITKEQYIHFFKDAVDLVFKKIRPDEYAILMQTDRKWQGEWVDKSFLANLVAQENGMKLLWHKVIQNRDGVYLQRPTYTHLMAFSKLGTPGEAFPDVISCGQHLYKNGTSPNATCYVMNFLKKKKITNIVDPFVGRGTIPFIAKLFKIECLGIDIDPEQCEYARKLINNKKMINIIVQTDYFQLNGSA